MPRRSAPAAICLMVSLFVASLGSQSQSQTQSSQAGFDRGRQLAEETLKSLNAQSGVELLSGGTLLGYLIAEGDSWFDYPGIDVIDALREPRFGPANNGYYKVFSAANAGDTVEEMAYDARQREGFAQQFRAALDQGKQNEVKAILLSGGGNDIAGKEFHVLLNHLEQSQALGLPVLDVPLVDAFIDRLGRNLEGLIGLADAYAHQVLGRTANIPILIHGYAEPVPDGRGFLIGRFFPGPWLEPGFTAKGYVLGSPTALDNNTVAMTDLIRRFNARIARIPAALSGRADVRYLDVRKKLQNIVAGAVYKKSWSNELHPEDAAFREIAREFHAVIK
jgi:hypothetical protein